MDKPQRPFACTVEGCDMTFTNEDHLNWHHKKHVLILNLGHGNKNSDVADQTPTPTRFIRNCEEVGLFQDLQNVNPFDETFKNAIETTKNGGSLEIPNNINSDDTLHTPHILPHQVEETASNNNNRNKDKYTDIVYICAEQTKNKLKKTLINKEAKKKLNVMVASVDKINKRLAAGIISNEDDDESETEVVGSKKQRTSCRKRQNSKNDIEKVREMNRAAQNRCRKRKQIQQKKMEEDCNFYRIENHRLNLENQNYRHKFESIKKLLDLHRSSGNPILNEIDKILCAPLLELSKTAMNDIKPNKVVPVMQNVEPNNGPMLIQVVGNISTLAVSVKPKQ